MALFNVVFCRICVRFTEEQWNKHLFSCKYLHGEVNGYWPASFPQRKLTRDEGMKLEEAFWEMIYNSVEVLALYDFLNLYFRMCTKIKNYNPVPQFVGGLMMKMKMMRNSGDMVIEMI